MRGMCTLRGTNADTWGLRGTYENLLEAYGGCVGNVVLCEACTDAWAHTAVWGVVVHNICGVFKL